MYQKYRVSCNSMMELSNFAKLMDREVWNTGYLVSLSNLANEYLGQHLKKDGVDRMSNWNEALSSSQRECMISKFYDILSNLTLDAANDVIAGLLIYVVLEGLRVAQPGVMPELPQMSGHSDIIIDGVEKTLTENRKFMKDFNKNLQMYGLGKAKNTRQSVRKARTDIF